MSRLDPVEPMSRLRYEIEKASGLWCRVEEFKWHCAQEGAVSFMLRERDDDLEPVAEWCRENCNGAFAVMWEWGSIVFQKSEDATLFKIAHGAMVYV